MTNNNTNFVSTELDLDRDVPNGPIEEEQSYVDSLLTTGFDVDVDENGPFITATSVEDDYDGDWVSECCGAELIIHDQLCGDCKEHTDRVPEDEDQWMKLYLDANPDFDAALNGHWEYV